MSRPRLSRPSGLPAEVWLVVALLATAGLFTGVPVLRALPDAFSLVTDGGLWDSIGPLVFVLLVELGLVAVACFALAWLLSQGDPVARVVAVVVGASLAFALLAGDVLDGTSATVTLVCSVGTVLGLTLPPRAREFFASRSSSGGSPRPVVAAETIVMMVSALLLAVGVAFLPLSPVELKFAVVGLVLVGISVACFKLRRRLKTADTPARTLVSALMAGDVVAVLIGSEGGLTGPLYIPLGLAVAVVALLWLAPESQAYFGSGPAPGRMGAGLGSGTRGARRLGGGGAAAGRSGNGGLVAEGSGPPLLDAPPSPFPSSPAQAEQTDQWAPAAADGPPPAEAFRAQPARAVRDDPRPPPSSRAPVPPPPSARPAAPATPPPWLLDAPPAGFWPPEATRAAAVPADPRRPEPTPAGPGDDNPGQSARGQSERVKSEWGQSEPGQSEWGQSEWRQSEWGQSEARRYEVVDLGPTTPDEVGAAPALGIHFDTTSWFPVLEGDEEVREAYLVSMVMFDDSGVEAVFRGTSTLLVTSSRLLGVCPRGESGDRPLDGGAGRVAVWSVLLDQLDWLSAEGSDGGQLVLRGWDADGPWALLGKARVAADGAFRPSPLAELADVVNRAKHASA